MRRLSLLVSAFALIACQDESEITGPTGTPHLAIEVAEPVRLTWDPAFQYHPDVAGDLVIWKDDRNDERGDIWAYDFNTGEEREVTAYGNVSQPPRISGQWVVWSHFAYTACYDYDVYAFNLETGQLVPVATTPCVSEIYPNISGDRIVWAQIGSSYDIYMYDLNTGAKTNITNSPSVWESAPDISGDIVVWMDQRQGYGNLDIYMYDLSTGMEKPVSTAPNDQSYPRVDGQKIVYNDYRIRGATGYADIYVFDIATGTETPIRVGDVAKYGPVISGDRIVWYEHDGTTYNLHGFDLADGSESRLTSVSSTFRPAIHGNRIVWYQQVSGGGLDVFALEIQVEVIPSISALRDGIDTYLADGAIDNIGIVESLRALLDQAEAALARGNTKSATATLTNALRLVNLHAGRHIDVEAAQRLAEMLQAVIDDLS